MYNVIFNYSDMIKKSKERVGDLSYYHCSDELCYTRLFNTVQRELDNIVYNISVCEDEKFYKSHGLYKIVLKYKSFDNENITIEDINRAFNQLGINTTSIKGYMLEDNITFVCLFSLN